MKRYADQVNALGLRLDRDLIVRIAVFGLAVDLAIALSTLLPSAPVIPQWPQFLLFPLIFVIHFRTVSVSVKRRLKPNDILRRVPRLVAGAFMCLFLGAWLAGLLSITHIRGQPTTQNGRRFLNDHGYLIPVSQAEYDHALVLQQRIFTLIPSVFFGLGILANARPPWGIERDDAAPER